MTKFQLSFRDGASAPDPESRNMRRALRGFRVRSLRLRPGMTGDWTQLPPDAAMDKGRRHDE
jgi:hypothetical protein